MIRLIRAEILKVTTTKFVYGLGLAIVGLTALATLVSLVQDGTDTLHSMSAGGGLAKAMGNMYMFTVLPLILGLTAVPGEFRHGTIIPALLTQPHRGRLIAAKAITCGASAALMMLAAIAVLVGLATVWGVALGVRLPLVDDAATCAALRLTVASAALCLLGLGLGAVIRNQVAAIAGGLIWALVIEQLADGMLPAMAKWFPFNSSTIFDLGARSVTLGQDMPQWWISGLVLAAYTAIACVAGTLVLRHRDIT